MSEVLDHIVEDLTNESPPGRRHNFGVGMTRFCLWLIVGILTVIAWTGNHLLDEIDAHLVDLKGGMTSLSNSVTILQIDMAQVKQRQRDLER